MAKEDMDEFSDSDGACDGEIPGILMVDSSSTLCQLFPWDLAHLVPASPRNVMQAQSG